MAIVAQDDTDARVVLHVEAIRAILEADLFEDQMGAALREYVRENIPDIELMAEVHDRLASEKIISKANYRALWNK